MLQILADSVTVTVPPEKCQEKGGLFPHGQLVTLKPLLWRGPDRVGMLEGASAWVLPSGPLPLSDGSEVPGPCVFGTQMLVFSLVCSS